MNCVTIFLTTIDLALQGIISSSEEEKIFEFCSIYNAIEILLKVIGFGLKRNLRDKLLIIDILSFIYFSTKTLLSSMNFDNSYLRFIKTVILLRNIRLFSLISYMQIILFVIHHTSLSIMNLALILFVFLFSFALFGLEMFGNRILSLKGDRFIYFDTLFQSFFSVFNLITFDNWYTLIIDGINNGFAFSMIIFIFSAIIVGSFILLNLFMAIVLEGFEYVTASFEPDKPPNIKSVTSFSKISLKKSPMCSPRNSKKEKNSERRKSERDLRFLTFTSQLFRMGVRKNGVVLTKEDRSLGLFARSNVVRRLCTRIAAHRRFRIYLFILYLLHASLMAYETFHSEIYCYHGVIKPDNKPDWEESVSKFQFICLMAINTGFCAEIMVKIIKNGLFANETAFLKGFLNSLDFLSVFLHYCDWFVRFPIFYQVKKPCFFLYFF